MSGELRKVWVCIGEDCGLRVRNLSGEPIPVPRRWQDGLCPHCRIKRAWDTEGKEAADALSAKLLKKERNYFKRPIKKADTRKPKGPAPSPVVEAQKEKVKQAALAHPDWTSEQIGKAIHIPGRKVTRYRAALGLSRQVGLTSTQREEIARALVIQIRPDEDVAAEFGVKTSAVIGVRKDAGLSSYQTRLREQREGRIAEAATKHPEWGPKRIARELGMPLNNVRRSHAELKKSGRLAPAPAPA
jgi:hypothetical protein